MVDVVWTTGAVEDIQTAQLKPFMIKYIFNRYRKDKDLDNLVTEYNMITNMENKIEQKELPKQNFITFSNIWNKSFKEVGKMDIAELAKDYLSEEVTERIRLNKDYPKVMIKDAHTSKGIAEFSGYSTSKNYERDEEYPEDMMQESGEKDKKDNPIMERDDADKPKKFSMLQEALIDGNYNITKKDFNELYSNTGIKISGFEDGKLGENAKGTKTLSPTEVKVVLTLKADNQWSRNFLKKSGFMPQMEDFAYTTEGSRKEYTSSSKEPRIMQDKKMKKDVPYFSPELMENPEKQIEYSAGADRRNKQIDEMRIHDSSAGMRFRNMVNSRRKSILKGNKKFPEEGTINAMLVKAIKELDMHKLVGNSILKNPMLLTDAEIELKISSSGKPKDKFVINTITIQPEIKKMFSIKPVKKLVMETMSQSKSPMLTPSSQGVAYGGKENYTPSIKERERLIKSIKVRYSELDDINDGLNSRASEIKEELNQNE
tara:strand:+ start:2105 stop:3565 length:1461 start_codon:yes stop_codon:yes gene_type:complete